MLIRQAWRRQQVFVLLNTIAFSLLAFGLWLLVLDLGLVTRYLLPQTLNLELETLNFGLRLLVFSFAAGGPHFTFRAGVAQLVEQLICNHQVGGSSPFTGSSIYGCFGDNAETPVLLL